MATQAGIGVGKILFVAGAGYTSMVLFQSGKLSGLLGELQAIVKGLEKSGDRAEGDGDYADAISAQVRRLASEVRQLSSSTRQITVLNGNSGQLGYLPSLLVPAASLGALGYVYMWWKGISFSDFMYVTKHNMANAVSNLTKHLESVSEALANTKKHLTQRTQNLDDKMLKQNEISRLIKDDVGEVQKTLTDIDYDLNALQRMVHYLDGKITSLDNQQMFAVNGIKYLCDFVEGRKVKMPEELQGQLKITGKSCSGLLTFPATPGLHGLKEFLTDNVSGGIMGSAADVITPYAKEKLEYPPRALHRAASTSLYGCNCDWTYEISVKSSDFYLWKQIMEQGYKLQVAEFWVVHNGNTVNVWNNCWLGVNLRLTDVTLQPIGPAWDWIVADIIQSDGSWNTKMLAAWLSQNILDSLSGIVLPESTAKEDELIWPLSSSGDFTFKSASDHFYSPPACPINGLRRIIWKLPVTERVWAFLWLVLRGQLLTFERMARWGISDGQCKWCTCISESLLLAGLSGCCAFLEFFHPKGASTSSLWIVFEGLVP